MKKDKQTTTKNTDITGRKRADEEASRMITVVRDSNDAIMIQDYEGKILAWNYGAEHLFGYSEQEALQMTIWQLAPPDKVAEQKDFNRRIFAGEKVVSFETQRLAKDGRLLDIWLTVTKLVDETGKVIGIASTERDITERKRKEEEAKSAKSLLDTVIDSSPFAMWISDREGMLIRTNRSLRETLNLTDEQLIGKYNVLKDVNLEMQGVMPMVRAVFEKYTPARFIIPWKASNAGDVDFKGGRDLYIDVSIFPILDNEGALTNVVCQWVDITKRNQAEEKLRESEEKYSKAFQISPNAIMITRAKDGNIMEVNDTFSSISGFTREESMLNSSISLSLWANIEDRKWVLSALKDGGEVKNKEFQFKIKNGNLITGLFSSRVIHMAGEPYILSSISDITERKRAEEALSSSEAFLNGVIEQSPESLWVSDSDGTMIRMNPACRKLFGITDEEVVGKYNLFKDNLIEEQGFMPLVEAVFRKGEIARFTIDYDLPRVEHIKVSGAMHRIIDVVISPIKDLSGKVTNVIIQHKDITERKRAEEKLRESEAKFRDTVKYLDEGYYSCTMEGLVLDHNLAFNRILGIDLNRDMKGAQLPDFWQEPEDRKVYLKEFMATGSINTYPINAKKSNGEKIVVIASSHLVKDEKSKPVRIEGTFLDITKRKQAEETIRNSEARLRTILNATPFPIAIVDIQDNKIDFWSDSALALFGHTAPTAAEWYELAYPDPDYRGDVVERWKPFLEKARSSGQAVNTGEYRITCHDGSVRICELHAAFLTDNLIVIFNDITERKQAEEKLRESETRLSTIFKNDPTGFFIVNEKTRIIYDVNDSTLEIIGLPREDVVGKVCHSFLCPAEMGGCPICDLGQVVDRSERVLLKPDGTRVPILKTVVPIKLNGENYFLESFIDITERKKAEEALRLKNNVFDASIAANSIADMNGTITEANDAFLRVWGYPSKDEVIGKPLPQFINDQKEAIVIVTAMNSTGQWEGDYTAKRKDGSTFIAYGLATTVKDEKGTVIGYQSAVIDVTGQREAEKELKRHRDHLEQLVAESTAELMQSKYLLDETGRLARVGGWEIDLVKNELTWTDTVYQIHEISRDYKPTVEAGINFYAPEAVPVISECVKQAIENGKPFDVELQLITAKKNRLWVRAIGQVYKEGGKVVKVGGVFQDIDERKKAEMSIQGLNESLKRNNTELEASNKELEAFSYSVSHDLRAPLRTIDGFSHALLEDYDDKLDVQGKDYLRRVRAATQMMAQLIDDILKLSRVTRTEMNIEKVNLTRIARSVIDELQKSQPERFINIKIADGLEDTADSRLMRLALENLLGNAWKFTGKQAEAVIEFGATKEGERKVYFIRDNGAGFDMAYADKLFAPFQRLHTMEEYPGTGIGLATVQRVIHRHGGRVWAEGQVGKGATFYFSLQ